MCPEPKINPYKREKQNSAMKQPCPEPKINPYKREKQKSAMKQLCPEPKINSYKREKQKSAMKQLCPEPKINPYKREKQKSAMKQLCPEPKINPYKREKQKSAMKELCPELKINPYKREKQKSAMKHLCPEPKINHYKREKQKSAMKQLCPEPKINSYKREKQKSAMKELCPEPKINPYKREKQKSAMKQLCPEPKINHYKREKQKSAMKQLCPEPKINPYKREKQKSAMKQLCPEPKINHYKREKQKSAMKQLCPEPKINPYKREKQKSAMKQLCPEPKILTNEQLIEAAGWNEGTSQRVCVVMRGSMMVFALTPESRLTQNIARNLNLTVGEMTRRKLANTETLVEIRQSVRGKDVYLIFSCSKDFNNSILDLLMVVEAMKNASVRTVTIVLPSFPYAMYDCVSRVDRCPIARLVADMLQSVNCDRVLTMDLHTPQVQGYFDVPVDNITAEPAFRDWIKELHLNEAVLVTPNPEGTKRVANFSESLGMQFAIVHIGEAVDNAGGGNENRYPAASLVGNVKGLHNIRRYC
ncbi:hypothetical protein ACHWQZ_G017215 [Mnemiopsis leidyi]